MESRHRRTRLLIGKWTLYTLLLLLCAVLQTMPGLLQVGNVKPIYILPLCIAIAVQEGEFAGSIFGMIGGLLWDYTAGVIVGVFAVLLLIICFCASLLVQLYLRGSTLNFFLLCLGSNLLVLSTNFMFFYYMQGYENPWYRYGTVVVPMAFYGAVIALPLFRLVRKMHTQIFVIE